MDHLTSLGACPPRHCLRQIGYLYSTTNVTLEGGREEELAKNVQGNYNILGSDSLNIT